MGWRSSHLLTTARLSLIDLNITSRAICVIPPTSPLPKIVCVCKIFLLVSYFFFLKAKQYSSSTIIRKRQCFSPTHLAAPCNAQCSQQPISSIPNNRLNERHKRFIKNVILTLFFVQHLGEIKRLNRAEAILVRRRVDGDLGSNRDAIWRHNTEEPLVVGRRARWGFETEVALKCLPCRRSWFRRRNWRRRRCVYCERHDVLFLFLQFCFFLSGYSVSVFLVFSQSRFFPTRVQIGDAFGFSGEER